MWALGWGVLYAGVLLAYCRQGAYSAYQYADDNYVDTDDYNDYSDQVSLAPPNKDILDPLARIKRYGTQPSRTPDPDKLEEIRGAIKEVLAGRNIDPSAIVATWSADREDEAALGNNVTDIYDYMVKMQTAKDSGSGAQETVTTAGDEYMVKMQTAKDPGSGVQETVTTAGDEYMVKMQTAKDPGSGAQETVMAAGDDYMVKMQTAKDPGSGTQESVTASREEMPTNSPQIIVDVPTRRIPIYEDPEESTHRSEFTTPPHEAKNDMYEDTERMAPRLGDDSTTAAATTKATTTTTPSTTTTTATTTTMKTTTPTTTTIKFNVDALLAIIANLTYDYDMNLTEQFNETLIKYSVPTCATPTTTQPTTTTTEIPPEFNFANTTVIAKCFVCGLDTIEIPRKAYCADAFAGDFIPLVPVDPSAKGQIARYRKYCRYLDVNHYITDPSEPRSMFGRWTGGCSVRWTDLSGVYTQRTCRNRKHATTGRHFASKRMAKLEMTLSHVDNGCIISPMASLLPLSRGISLFARFHACVCTGSWCNEGYRSQHWTRHSTMLSLLFLSNLYV